MNGMVWRFPIGVRAMATLLLNRRARQAMRGLIVLRRVYEHMVVLATIEGARPVRLPYYESYVDALSIVAAKATLISRML